jgi:AAA family ATP:ADP antiporter
MPMTIAPSGAEAPIAPPTRPLERFLRLFTDVRDGEGPQLLLLAFNTFLILTSYYLMKPVREVLILDQPGGAELKSYAYGAQAVLLLAIVPLYGALAARLSRQRLINAVTLFFIACLPLFCWAAGAEAPIGFVFFLWTGIFSLMVIAQFWGYANDIYSLEAGKRLFAVIAFGSSAGAVFGAWLAGRLVRELGAPPLLLVAAGVLGLSLLLFNWTDRRALRDDSAHEAAQAQAVIGGPGPFRMVLSDRYLLLMALVILLLNCINSAGEYILSSIVKQAADAQVAAGTMTHHEVRKFIGGFFADYFGIVNLAGMVLQLFAVSRLVKWIGVPAALLVLPVVALGSYAVAALLPTLVAVRWAKVAENSVDYSLMNTVRHMLFLPTTREQKYKAKQVIDSFAARAGDVVSAGIVWLGTAVLTLSVAQFAWINVALVVVWIGVCVATGAEFRRRSAAAEAAPDA